VRILEIVDRIDADSWGGMQVVALTTARRLAERGHDVTILAFKPGRGDVDASPVRIVRLGERRKGQPAVFEARGAMAKLVASKPFDIIHSHFAYAALGPSLVPKRGASHIRTYHGSWDLEGFHQDFAQMPGLLRRPLLYAKRALRYAVDYTDISSAARVVALSDFSVRQLARFGVPPERICKIRGAVDLETFAPRGDKALYRRSIGHASDGPLLFAAARFERRKGLQALIAAMPAILARHPGATLLIAGDGPERPALEAQIVNLRLGSAVRLIGYLAQSLPDYYRAADVFIVPSQRLETFGLVTVEAIASGTPVIGTSSGATPEILRDIEPRLITQDGSPEAITAAVLDFLSGDWRHALTQGKLVDHARVSYSWDAHVDRLEAMYAEVRTDVTGRFWRRSAERAATRDVD